VLRSGGIIAVPTDTIYGLACLACNKESLDKIYRIKGRDSIKPLAICVSKIEDLEK
jgi:tRNA A37 threonylcarbamoyladenosine synthetase subunit TsaC/SUA5/YrdC